MTLSAERIRELREWVKRQKDASAWLIEHAEEHDLSTKDIASANESLGVTTDLLAVLDEVERLRGAVEDWKYGSTMEHDKAMEFLARAEKAEAELAALRCEAEAARPLLECLVDYVREHLADHLVALGETTLKNKIKADDMRRAIKDAEAALAYRQKKGEIK
jgi:hypothetical protein